MKRFLLGLLILLISLTGVAQDFTVENCTVDIKINREGYFDVVEKYDVNFTSYKHGIYRTIQTSYDLLNYKDIREKRKIRISSIKVPGHHFEAPPAFIQKVSNSIDIKIGDKNKTIIGPQHYEIQYRVHNAILFEDSQIRFYWNIKPDGWYADFKNINFTIHVPENIDLTAKNCFVYDGNTGTETPSTNFNLTYKNNEFSGFSKEGFISHPGQSVTILINLPANSINESKPLWPFWNNFGWTFIVIALLGGFYHVWNKYGRDDKVVTTTSYYPPKNIDPAMAGFLIDDRSDNSDLIALLAHWGSKGLIKIEEIKTKGIFASGDTKLIRLKPLPDDAPLYEKIIFNGLFDDPLKDSFSLSRSGRIDLSGMLFGEEKEKPKPGEVMVSSLKDSFYTTMGSARDSLKDKAQPYYEAESRKIKNYTLAILLIGGTVLAAISLFYWGIFAAIAIGITTMILILLNTFMVKKNKKGNEILSELKGFKNFIKIAEENKLKMLIKEDPGYFEDTMGYALAFGLFEGWAKKFADLHVSPPDWYGSTGGNLNMYQFSRSFSKTIDSTRSTMISSPSSSSSGGGSSGGGFGGGGGGSW